MNLKQLFSLLFMPLVAFFLLQGCAVKKQKIRKLFKQSAIVQDHFTGFALYDLDEHRMIYELNADKYYTPASNTKLLTFYTCLKMLGDSIPTLQYVQHGDSLIFWATGDPSFLHSDLQNTRGLAFLRSSGKHLYFAPGRYQNKLFGAGWAWDDYNDYYQAEINELPLEDNVAQLYAGADGLLHIKPAYMSPYLHCDSAFHPARFSVQRDLLSNSFVYPAMPLPAGFRQEIPWKTSTALSIALLQDTLHAFVDQVNAPLPAGAKTLYGAPSTAVYRRMLQPSDNFIAEQLLLVCSAMHFGVMNKDSVINYAQQNLLADLPDKPQWVDGSGLSRYNLITPRSIIKLLCKISDQVNNDELLHSMMPIGGVAGTIKNAYKTDNGQPFIWAKTGTVSNNHNQSGYLITRKGRRLAFSFMNNNYTRPTAQVRDEMVRIMTYIHNKF